MDVSTLAGIDVGGVAPFYSRHGVAVDARNGRIFVSSDGDSTLRTIEGDGSNSSRAAAVVLALAYAAINMTLAINLWSAAVGALLVAAYLTAERMSVRPDPIPLGDFLTFFLPPNYSIYGLYTGFGTFYQTNYTRALRPFVDLGVTHNTVTGQGYSALAGVSGNVFGADRLTLFASTGKGGRIS